MSRKVEPLSKEAMVGRDPRVVFKGMHDIQREFDLEQAAVKKLIRALTMEARTDGNHVIFARAYCPFSPVRFLLIRIDKIPF
jgi:hypothetical protein